MNLLDIVHRQPPVSPWEEGDNIPWHEPGFSERMLLEHLSQEHDAASRRADRIDQQVAWIHDALLSQRSTRVLDLGCGPGLYTSRLAALGHLCTGIDYSPASIRYAKEQASAQGLNCAYLEGDVREADYGGPYGLVMMLYGELNVFKPKDAQAILAKAHDALGPGGLLLLEPHSFEAVEGMGQEAPSWYSSPSGLFADAPHLCLTEAHWHEAQRAATIRYYLLEAATGQVTRYAQSMQAYRQSEYHTLLQDAGFAEISIHPSLTGSERDTQAGLFAITARKVRHEHPL